MISVCIAVYNGEKYLYKQIFSILNQLSDNDEVIISDDSSTDKTLSIIEELDDARIKLVPNKGNRGPVGNFENALSQASGDYIFLADQDDIWLEGRVSEAIKCLKQPGIECVICNRIIIDANGNTDNTAVIKEDFTKWTFWKILLHNKYIGCCMAFTRKLLKQSLPFPNNLPMHDLWIGLLSHKQNSVKFIPQPLIGYRRHGENVTTGKSPYSILYRIWYRFRLLYQISRRLSTCK